MSANDLYTILLWLSVLPCLVRFLPSLRRMDGWLPWVAVILVALQTGFVAWHETVRLWISARPQYWIPVPIYLGALSALLANTLWVRGYAQREHNGLTQTLSRRFWWPLTGLLLISILVTGGKKDAVLLASPPLPHALSASTTAIQTLPDGRLQIDAVVRWPEKLGQWGTLSIVSPILRCGWSWNRLCELSPSPPPSVTGPLPATIPFRVRVDRPPGSKGVVLDFRLSVDLNGEPDHGNAPGRVGIRLYPDETRLRVPIAGLGSPQ